MPLIFHTLGNLFVERHFRSFYLTIISDIIAVVGLRVSTSCCHSITHCLSGHEKVYSLWGIFVSIGDLKSSILKKIIRCMHVF